MYLKLNICHLIIKSSGYKELSFGKTARCIRATHQCKVKLCVKNVIINFSPLSIRMVSGERLCPYSHTCKCRAHKCLYFGCLFVHIKPLSVNYVNCHTYNSWVYVFTLCGPKGKMLA